MPQLRKQTIRIPFDRTSCGTPFYMRAGKSEEVQDILSSHCAYFTDFFQIFFFSKANGHVLLDNDSIQLSDNQMVFIAPDVRQEWHVEERKLEYSFVFFREDFIDSFISDPFFMYRLLYCYQTDTPSRMQLSKMQIKEYTMSIDKMRTEIANPVADSYLIAVSVLVNLLLSLNRVYANTYNLPFCAPKNTYAYQFKRLLEHDGKHPKTIEMYADEMKISRISLNNAVKTQFGVTAIHLIHQKMIASIKNDILFSNRSVTQLSIDYGFSHPSHFMRFFKNKTGQTISQFRCSLNIKE